MKLEKQIRNEIDIKFNQNFTDFWYKILSFSVLRFQKICSDLGGPKIATVVQVIAWHHYLLSLSERKPQLDSSFDTALKSWSDFKVDENKKNKQLSISLISSLSCIPFETTRRILKDLEKKNWVIISKKNGVLLNTNSELNKLIVLSIHPYEKNLLKEFLVSFMLAGNKKNISSN